MPDFMIIQADEWEAYQKDMAAMQEQMFTLWCEANEKELAKN